jgi:hypothetical protein
MVEGSARTRRDGIETRTQMWPGQSTARYGLKKKKTVLTSLLNKKNIYNFENVVRFGSFMFRSTIPADDMSFL